jgi:membrane-associated phospholipid phosphatase
MRIYLSICILVLGLASPSGGSAEDIKKRVKGMPPSPFAISLGVDAPLLSASLGAWIIPTFISGGMPGPACDPCDPSGLNALDRPVIDYASYEADILSDVALVAVPVLALSVTFVHFPIWGWQGVFEDFVMIAEAMALSGLVQQITRYAVRRPRPFMYREGVQLASRHKVGATLSFFSGHTTLAFSSATAFAYIFTVRQPDSPWVPLVWITSMLGASVMPVARVFSGEHFWTDVIVGAGVGAAFGILIPALHRTAQAKFGKQNVHLTGGPGDAGLGVVGRF